MILVVGCGFLGSYLLKNILADTHEPVLATVRNKEKIPRISGVEFIECDVSDASQLESLAERCKGQSVKVFYFAACHYIDYILDNPEEALKVNVDALKSFIEKMPHIEKLFFASTDCVYGEGGSSLHKFKETDELKPVNVYGKQKIMAENIVVSNGFTVCRLPFMLGESLSGVPHFYDKIKASLLKGEQVEMIDGLYRSVLSYNQVAEILCRLSEFEEKLPSVINICSDKGLSKYEMGLVLAKNINAPSELIKKISEEEGQKFFKDKRASNGVMDNTLLKSLLGEKEILWEEEKC